MNASLDLKNLERKAWVSYHQDGLFDLYLGLLLFCIALTNSLLVGVLDSWPRYIIFCILLGGSWLLFWAGRRFITTPRLGRVKFSAARRKRKIHLAIIMSFFVLLNVLLLFLTIAARNNPDTWGRFMPQAGIFGLFVGAYIGSAIALITYFKDIPRGYYMALVYGITFAAVEIFENPALYWIGGALIFIPGVVLFVRFLQRHPLPPSEVTLDQPGV